ncbi:hypothetical protein JCM10450v2_003408 [Rhodotorula kratochvilovae]
MASTSTNAALPPHLLGDIKRRLGVIQLYTPVGKKSRVELDEIDVVCRVVDWDDFKPLIEDEYLNDAYGASPAPSTFKSCAPRPAGRKPRSPPASASPSASQSARAGQSDKDWDSNAEGERHDARAARQQVARKTRYTKSRLAPAKGKIDAQAKGKGKTTARMPAAGRKRKIAALKLDAEEDVKPSIELSEVEVALPKKEAERQDRLNAMKVTIRIQLTHPSPSPLRKKLGSAETPKSLPALASDAIGQFIWPQEKMFANLEDKISSLPHLAKVGILASDVDLLDAVWQWDGKTATFTIGDKDEMEA